MARTATAKPFSSKPILANRSRRETSALSSAAMTVDGGRHSMDTSREEFAGLDSPGCLGRCDDSHATTSEIS